MRHGVCLRGLGLAYVFVSAQAAEEPVELACARGGLSFGRADKGAVVSFKGLGVAELAAPKPGRLFSLSVSPRAQPAGELLTVASSEAERVTVERSGGEGAACVTLAYEGFAKGVERVVCTVRAEPAGGAARWGIRVQLRDGWVLERVQYPCVTLAAPLGAGAEDDAVVAGAAKGGVTRRPAELKRGTVVSLSQPGNLAAQFGCYYDAGGGFYTAAEDARGFPKDLIISRTEGGLEFSWMRPCFAEGVEEQAYDIVTAPFGGSGGEPADWRDAADLYKAWAQKQVWCSAKLADRADLPAWLKEGPAMVRFGREWLSDPARIERWLETCWAKRYPCAPLITAYWGWEKRGSWVTPDYFPLYPSDEAFARLMAKSRPLGCHAFPWPSGYHWTLTYDKRADGSFAWDDRARFDAEARAHAVHSRDGKLYIRVPSWLRGGETACLCGGDPWTLRWWNEAVCAPLARRGCELIQVDQVVGANWPACYAPGHGHPAGRGPWMTESFMKQLLTMRDAMRASEPDAVVCFEEPNEWFNHVVGLQDYRDCEAPREWASVFNYLYHEYLPTFQSNPRGRDRVMRAYCAANGQMPHLVPSGKDLEDEALVNGGFEPLGDKADALRGWEQVAGYQGQVWSGLASADGAAKHGGDFSLRLENVAPTDTVQVSQNVAADGVSFGGGGRYRLSAWLRTERLAGSGSVNFGVFAPGLKSMGQGGRLAFPAAGAGWARASADFVVPAGAEMLRIMCHVSGEAKVWVDDVTLEAIGADGGARTVKYAADTPDARFMRKWVELYHGEGRPWLLNGTLLHPPRLVCATVEDRGRPTPAVFHNAFHSPDGEIAVVLANATAEAQAVTVVRGGKSLALTVPGDDLLLLR
jgi:hypothetical protein